MCRADALAAAPPERRARAFRATKVFADQPSGVVSIGFANASRVGFAETDVPQPGIDTGDAGDFGDRRTAGPPGRREPVRGEWCRRPGTPGCKRGRRVRRKKFEAVVKL